VGAGCGRSEGWLRVGHGDRLTDWVDSGWA
jgi:hypothetical protein